MISNRVLLRISVAPWSQHTSIKMYSQKQLPTCRDSVLSTSKRYLMREILVKETAQQKLSLVSEVVGSQISTGNVSSYFSNRTKCSAFHLACSHVYNNGFASGELVFSERWETNKTTSHVHPAVWRDPIRYSPPVCPGRFRFHLER